MRRFWIFCFFSWVVCFFLAQPHMSTIYVVYKMKTILSQYWFFEMKWQHISIYSSTTEQSDIIHIMILTKYSDSRVYKSEFIACINIWFELIVIRCNVTNIKYKSLTFLPSLLKFWTKSEPTDKVVTIPLQYNQHKAPNSRLNHRIKSDTSKFFRTTNWTRHSSEQRTLWHIWSYLMYVTYT